MTIVSKDGGRRDWSGVRRFERDTGLDLHGLLTSVRRGGARTTLIRTGAMEPRRIEAIPILGIEDAVYGIHVWIGPVDALVPPHRPAAAISWSSEALQVQQVQQRLESWMMSTHEEDGFRRTRSPGEFFRQVVRCDDIGALIQMSTEPVPGDKLGTAITVLHDAGHLMLWHVVGRARNDDEHVGVRTLTHDISDVSSPVIGPLETLGLTAKPATDGPAAALLAFPPDSGRAIIAQWIGKVPAWVDWRRDGDVELIHPDDQSKLLRATTILEAGLPDSEAVTHAHIRAHQPSGWQPVTIVSRRYPGPVGARLHIVRIAKRDPLIDRLTADLRRRWKAWSGGAGMLCQVSGCESGLTCF